MSVYMYVNRALVLVPVIEQFLITSKRAVDYKQARPPL